MPLYRNILSTHLPKLALLMAGAWLCSCGNSTWGRLVGNDRDEHGCIGSAGYTWSYALHDCVRVWEAGIRFDSGPKQIYLIFSPDSTLAEIFTPEGRNVLCKRVKESPKWKPKHGQERVSVHNGIVQVYVDHFTYTRSKETSTD